MTDRSLHFVSIGFLVGQPIRSLCTSRQSRLSGQVVTVTRLGRFEGLLKERLEHIGSDGKSLDPK